MQIYLNTASEEEVREALRWRILDGITTNPSLLAAQGGDLGERLSGLCELVPGPVSAGVTSQDTEAMIEEGKALSSVHERILVRIPCLPAGIPAMAELSKERIPVDASLCFSLSQALMAAKAGVRMISVEVGGLDDVGQDGLTVLGNTLTMLDQFELKTRVQASRLRTPGHVGEAARMGADSASIDLDLLRRLAEHPLSEQSHRAFLETWRRAQN